MTDEMLPAPAVVEPVIIEPAVIEQIEAPAEAPPTIEPIEALIPVNNNAGLTAKSEAKKLVFLHPEKPAAEIYNELVARGFTTTLSSVATHRSDFLNSIAVIKAMTALAPDAAPVATPAPPAPPAKKGKKVKPPSRATRWADACARANAALDDLRALQEEYEAWKDNLPENLQSTPVGEKLEAVCELDIEGAIEMVGEAEGLDLPRGFGKD